MNKAFMQIYETVWKEIFPNHALLPIDKFKKLFTQDIVLPKTYKCEVNGSQLYNSGEYNYKRFISGEEITRRCGINDFMQKKVEIGSLQDVIARTKNIATFKGSKTTNSQNIEESDDIYSSNFIYNSTHIYNCQKMLFCNNNKGSEYLIASKGNGECNFGIRLLDSGGVSNSFDIHWCGKSSNSYFCHDASDLRECMFCFHTTSKQYCIANMQFEEEEYFKLKEKILSDYFKQLDDPNPFVSLSDL